MTSPQALPTISLIVPVHADWTNCLPCLQALRGLRPAPLEVILVTDGPMTDNCDLKSSLPLRILKTGSNVCGGPGAARNVGAVAAAGDVLLFIDSDVTVPVDLIEQVVQAFKLSPNTDAFFGSYDATPASPNFLSQYKNLLHHFVHQNGPEEVATFWTGCGAIRTSVFRALGGFDERHRHLEDVELGFRLTRHGCSIRICRSMQVKHLKRYSVSSLLRSDIMHRARPWSRFFLEAGYWPNDVTLQSGQMSSAFLLAVFVAFLFTGIRVPLFFGIAIIPFFGLLFLNRAFYLFLLRRRGFGFVVTALFWHWLAFGYSAAIFAWTALAQALSLGRPRFRDDDAVRKNAAVLRSPFSA